MIRHNPTRIITGIYSYDSSLTTYIMAFKVLWDGRLYSRNDYRQLGFFTFGTTLQ